MKENKVICRSLSEDSDNRALWNGDIWDSSNDTSRLQMRYDLKSGKTFIALIWSAQRIRRTCIKRDMRREP